MKKIVLVWTLVAVMMVSGLTIICLNIKNKSIDNLMEEELKKQAEKYLNLYVSNYPAKGKTKTISLGTLIDNGYDPKLEDGCDGYVEVENGDMGYKFKAYIKCPNYTTEGYKNS